VVTSFVTKEFGGVMAKDFALQSGGEGFKSFYFQSYVIMRV
jgi:hypothetical protein